MKASLLFFLLLILTGPLRAEPALTPASFSTSTVEAALVGALSEKRIVGAVLLISEDGHLVYQKAVGMADRESGVPVTLDTVFRLASVTKPLVSAAAMRLVENGTLNLDDPLTEWLPTFTPKLEDGSQPAITIRQLLTHTSGLSYGFYEPVNSPYHLLGVSDGVDQKGLSLEENLVRLGKAPLLHQPGTAFKYSLSTDVLGAVIAQATGKSLPEAMNELVLDPLSMTGTGFVPKNPTLLATAYANSEDGPVRLVDGSILAFGSSFLRVEPSRSLDPLAYPSGGGGMVSTAGDFWRFLETLRKGGGPILSQATVEAMTRDQLPPNVAGHKPGWGFGYGWAVLRDPVLAKVPQSAGTMQWGGVYGNFWMVDPARKLTVVLMTNTAFEGMAGRLVVEIRDAVCQSRTDLI